MANEIRIRGNLVSGTLSSSLTSGATSMSSAGLANLPAVGSTQHAVITIENEIVYVTAHTGGATTATILRAQEGTSAAAHSSPVAWVHGPIASDFGGALGYKQVVASSGTVGTSSGAATTLITAPAVTVPAGRRVKITAECSVQSSVANDTAVLQIMEGATMLQQRQYLCTPVNQAMGAPISIPVTPSAGSHTYTLTCWRNIGTGNVIMFATANVPAYILVEDLGPTA